MGKYLGSTSPIGMLEIQDLTPEIDGTKTTFSLIYPAPTPSSILVIYSGNILRPVGTSSVPSEYSLDAGGTKLVLKEAPVQGFSLHVVYLGRELTIPVSVGRSPLLVQVDCVDSIDEFSVSQTTLIPSALIVFKNGVQLRHHNTQDGVIINEGDFYITSENKIKLMSSPSVGDKLDFYILGLERTDLVTVDANSISTGKIQDGAVTPEKLNMIFATYNPVISTFSGMNSVVQHTSIKEYQSLGKLVKLRLKFQVSLSGTEDNKIRFTLPVNNDGSTCISGSATISSNTSVESGIVRWGAVNALDIYRQFAVNYSINQTYTIEVFIEYKAAS
jgi:hypothetical protein